MVQHKSNGITEEENGKSEETIFQKIMAEKFPELEKDINPQNEESQLIST